MQAPKEKKNKHKKRKREPTNMANSNGTSFVTCGIPSFGVTGCE